ncbi:MAG: hypothetical protein HQM09_09045 [Candidatus Riflebacteria bacterium]|nr:hypothetical protein [Candidatus Riflebacteria bacterium]
MVEVIVCVGTDCSYKGGLQIYDFLEHDPSLEGRINLATAKCFNRACKPDNAPLVSVNGKIIGRATLDKVLAAITEG